MEELEMEVGMHVVISHDISKTTGVYGKGFGMPEMAGKTFKIKDIQTGERGRRARIGGYTWHPHDLTEYSLEKKPEPFHFDIKELTIWKKNSNHD